MIKNVFFIIMCLFFLTACELFTGGNSNTSSNNNYNYDGRLFNAVQFSSSGKQSYVDVHASLIVETDLLQVYLKSGQSMSETDINYLVDNFENYYPTITNIYGTHTDVDRNGKIILLLFDINENIYSSNGYVAGYFNPDDLSESTLSKPSNNAEILYVECQNPDGREDHIGKIFVTLIHEFQHLINFNMNFVKKNRESDLWLNEALSESTEIVMLEAMSSNRLDIYNGVYGQRFPESIMKGNYFYTWNNDNYAIADYATASLFMYWLYLNAGGKEGNGETIISNIAKASLANRGTYKAVIEALGKTPINSLNTTSAWEDVLFAWLEANENREAGYPGGEDKYPHLDRRYELKLDSKIYYGANTNVALNPGDAVLTKERLSTENSTLGKRVISSNELHITLNKDTQIGGSKISVTLPYTETPASAQISMQRSVSVRPYVENRIIPITQGTLGTNNLETLPE